MKNKLLKIKFILGLVTWQVSLVIVSVGILVFSGIIVIASPQTVEGIQDTAVDIAKAAFSQATTINLGEDIEGLEMFVYNNLSKDSNIPLDIQIKEAKEGYYFELFPGAYKIIFFKEGYEPAEKNIVVEIDKKEIILNLKYPEIEEKDKIIDKEKVKETSNLIDNELQDSTAYKVLDEEKFNKDIKEVTIDDSATEIENEIIKNIEPDIEVLEINYYDLRNGEDVLIFAEIENNASISSPVFWYKFSYLDNGEWIEIGSERYSSPIPSHASKEIWFDWKAPEKDSIYNIRLEIDSNNEITESNEDNNIKEEKIYITNQNN